MVQYLGLPSHFITLTMNETGEYRSKEYEHIDDIMQTWDAAFTWGEAPIECNRAFIARFKAIFHDHILAGNQILGPVKDYAIRYECQGRGSLHVHICIRLADAQAVAALDQRIIAYVPAEHDGTSFIPPAEPLQARLFRHALNKQQHRCRATSSTGAKACLRDGHCKLLFPQPLHQDTVPVLHNEKRRYIYKYVFIRYLAFHWPTLLHCTAASLSPLPPSCPQHCFLHCL
jgi:hypothetical protein